MYNFLCGNTQLIMICYLSLRMRGTSIYKGNYYEEIISHITVNDNRLGLALNHHG